MKYLLVVPLIVGVIIPAIAFGQVASPAATYTVTGRVLSAIDDVVDGVSYTRVQFSIVTASQERGSTSAPVLGAGTTISAIVREASARAMVKSLNTSSTIDFRLAWFAEETYEVIQFTNQPVPDVTTTPATTPAKAPSVTRDVILFVVAAALAGIVLVLVRHRTRHDVA